MFSVFNDFMQDATVYIGGFIGAFWGALTLFVGIRSLILGRQQERFENAGEE